MGFLTHAWSLAVEEQSYLVWPVVFVLLGRRPRLLLGVALGGALASIVARQLLWAPGTVRAYYGSDTRADAILLGCARPRAGGPGGTRIAVGRRAAGAAAGLLLALNVVAGDPYVRWALTPATLAAVLVVAHVATARRVEPVVGAPGVGADGPALVGACTSGTTR